jgi:hypothetical protein
MAQIYVFGRSLLFIATHVGKSREIVRLVDLAANAIARTGGTPLAFEGLWRGWWGRGEGAAEGQPA